MKTLRRNKLWLVLTLILAMVCTIGGNPAFATMCSEPGADNPLCANLMGAASQSAPTTVCAMAQRAGHCCCGPATMPVTSPVGETLSTLVVTDCGCSVQAPAVPTSSAANTGILPAIQIALLPTQAVAFHLPTQAPQALVVVSTGIPRRPARSGAPSRAPPVC